MQNAYNLTHHLNIIIFVRWIFYVIDDLCDSAHIIVSKYKHLIF